MNTERFAFHVCDGYKLDHRRQLPAGITGTQSNWTPRASRIEGITEVVWFGGQAYIDKLTELWRDFFAADIDDVCKRFTRRVNGYLGPNGIGEEHLRSLHELRYLPLEFRALPEGTLCPLRVPMMLVESTHPDFAWLPNYGESLMSCELWGPCTTATLALRMRRLLDRFAFETGCSTDLTCWQGHDFSMRGMYGLGAAEMSGAAHLLAFTGTDTVPALDYIDNHYGPLGDDYLIGGSVPASEHYVMCAGGEQTELETFGRLLDLYPSGIFSVVSDTWDLWKVLTETMPALKDRIVSRDGKLVIRPDSGDPADILCGDPKALPGTPASKGVIELLWEVFGGTVTGAGFRELDSHIGAIYGDAITFERATQILSRLKLKGFASNCVVFGIGSFSYQYVTRDTFGFAMKATWAEVDGESRDLFKKPVTDDGLKFSAKGRLAVVRNAETGVLELINQATPEQGIASELKPVWRDGRFLKRETFDVIRNRVLSQL